MIHPEDLYDEILDDAPSPATIFRLVSRMMEEGRLDRVINRCKRALDTYPNDIPIRKLLAEACFESGRISRAAEELEKITEQLDSLATIYKLKAQVLDRQGREEEAAKTLRVYLGHNPDDKEALRLLERLTPRELQEPGRGVSRGAEPQTDRGEGEGGLDIATPTLAEVYYTQGQIQEAIKVYERVLEREPNDQYSQRRIAELKSMVEAESPPHEMETARERPPAGSARKKNERLIALLESWLSSIREMARA